MCKPISLVERNTLNLFILDENHVHDYADRHILKTIGDAAQMLCAAHIILDGVMIARHSVPNIISDPQGMMHPWMQFTRGSYWNYKYVRRHLRQLLLEYAMRFNKVHQFVTLWEQLAKLPKNIEFEGLGPIPQCMPVRYQVLGNPVEAYRNFYFGDKRNMASWSSPAGMPSWWKEKLRSEHGQH